MPRDMAFEPDANEPQWGVKGDGAAALASAAPLPPEAPFLAARGSAAYRRISLALFLSGFATFSALYSVQPLLPEFAKSFNTGAAESSLALSLTTGFLGLSILFAGAASEALGRKGLMFASLCAAAALNLCAALAPDWRMVLAARALEGIALGGVPAVAMAYLAEEIHPKGLGFTMGLYIGGNAFGGMMGRVATAALLDFASWRTALAVLSIADLFAAVGFFILLPASRNFIRRPGVNLRFHFAAWGEHLRDAGLPFLFLIAFLSMGSFVTVYNYAGFRLLGAPYNLSQTEVGLIFAAYIFGIAASPAAGALSDSFGRGPVLIASVLLTLAGLALTWLAPPAAVIAGIIALTIGFFAAHSTASGWVGQMAARSKGHAASLYLLAYYAGSSIVGSAGGWFWEQEGWTGVAAFTGALLTAALLAAVHLSRRAPRAD